MAIKIGTFNAENLFLRYKFLGKEVDQSKYIKEGWGIEKTGIQILDDGQRKNTARLSATYWPTFAEKHKRRC
jgi:hypothetical protein